MKTSTFLYEVLFLSVTMIYLYKHRSIREFFYLLSFIVLPNLRYAYFLSIFTVS